MTLRQLDEQLAPTAWDASVDQGTHEFVDAVLLHVAEYEQDHRTDADLRERLRTLLNSARLVPVSDVVVRTGSSATVLVPGIVISAPQFADTRLVGVSS